ncbi:cytochrome c family protein [Candidatus Magnetoovum chiemensis]|nr:cytochrome c family protein [Candidatus Magnetoovum chiemensis]
MPTDFKIVDGDYKYQFHNVKNEDYWKNYPVKHMGRDFCKQCHPDMIEKVSDSGHQNVQCENCHAMFDATKKSHPIDLKEDFNYLLDIGIERSRELCKRCHAVLSYRPKTYASFSKGPINFKMIDPTTHNAGIECVTCHDVHKTGFK